MVARTTALVLPEPGRAVAAPGGAFFEAWMRRAAAGERPAVVLASRAADPAYLAARGATAVLDWV